MTSWILVPCKVHYRDLVPDKIEALEPIYLERITREADSIFEIDEHGQKMGRSWTRDSHWCLFPWSPCECGEAPFADRRCLELRRGRLDNVELRVRCGCGRERSVAAVQQTLPV
jgi:hypothetical protein